MEDLLGASRSLHQSMLMQFEHLRSKTLYHQFLKLDEFSAFSSAIPGKGMIAKRKKRNVEMIDV